MSPALVRKAVSIIIVNWNSGVQLRSCLDSLHGLDCASVFVVDNDSTDGSELTALGRPDTSLIRAGSNLGFAKACNAAAANAKSPYLLFLNPDAVVPKSSIELALRSCS